jgi:long-chain acyl-CoA synthetase
VSTDLPPTIAELPFFASGRFPKPDLIGRCHGDRVEQIPGRDVVERVRDISLGLTAMGMQPGDRVALLAESRPEWLLADFAVLAAGAVTVPIYPTLSVEQVAFILRDSEATLAIVSTPTQLGKILDAVRSAPGVRVVVVMDPPNDVHRNGPGMLPLDVIGLAGVAARGHRRIMDGWGVGRAFHDSARRVQPADLATIIYTSGTTGEPKGVMLTHGNLVSNIAGIRGVLDLGPDDLALSFLPLCHAFERMVAYTYLASGVSIAFAESLDTVARDLKRVRPTIITGVPRVFEKLHAEVIRRGRTAGGIKRGIFDWAVRVAEARGARLPDGRPLSMALAWQSKLAERLVFRKVREGVGGRLRFAVSGSAALRPEIGRFFYGLGVPILEGYGLTEAAPVLAVTPLERIRFGTVGRPLPNVELRIAEDGEILARGPNVMAGYYKRPTETAEAIRDGWLHTGDVGSIDRDGVVRITDRKKELLVTSGGKKIAPQPIEAALRANELVQEAVLIGDGRRFPSALIVPDFAALCRQIGAAPPADAAAARALVARADVSKLVDAVVERVNDRLAQFERIKRFAVLPQELTVAAGELTPTLKVKRRVIETKYRDAIEALYRE